MSALSALAFTNVSGQRLSADRIRLIVRGDDFGVTHASNLALVEAFAEGIMTSASIMAVGPWFPETAALARAHPEWTIGVHLSITSEWNRLRWRPILPASAVPSLVGPGGFFYHDGYFWRDPNLPASHLPLLAPGAPDGEEVERELRAQVELARAAGVRIDYLDCHMGVTCNVALLPIMKRLASDLCVPILELGVSLGERAIGFRPTEKTVTGLREGLKQMLNSLTAGLWLYVAHPAHDTPELRAIDTEWGPEEALTRSWVLDAWTHPETRQTIADREIELVSVRDLWDYATCGAR